MSRTPLLDDLLEGLRELRGPNSYQVFESVVTALLRAEAQEAGAQLEFPSGKPGTASRYEFDVVIPRGLGNIHGEVGIELKLFLRGRASTSQLGEALTRMSMMAARRAVDNALLIHTAELTDRQSIELHNFMEQLPERPRLYLWGTSELERLLQSHQEVLADAREELTLMPLRQEFLAPERNWRLRTSDQLKQLAQTFRADGVTLVLGAGVSSSAGLPSWDPLLSSLSVGLLAEELRAVDVTPAELLALARAGQRLRGSSPLLDARFLRRGLTDGVLGSSASFNEAVAGALYADVPEDASSPLIDQLARISMPTRSGVHVRSIVTYNFDDLLERALDRAHVKHASIYGPQDHPSADQLPVYHVHGFLPRDVQRYPDVERSLLAFSEEGYHELFRNPYHWTNIVQLNAFRESTCLLIGLSLSDPNLRRLLEIATEGEDKPRHVALMRRHTFEDLKLDQDDTLVTK